MEKDGKISPRQSFFIVFMLLIGIFYLVLPRNLVLQVGTDGWIVLLLGMVFALVTVFAITTVGKKYSDKTVVEYAPLILGNIVGKVIAVVFVLYFSFLAIGSLRLLVELLRSTLLTETPRNILLLGLILLLGWLLKNGIEDIARFTEFVSPIIIILTISILLADFRFMEPLRLQPVLQNSLFALGKGVLGSVSYFGLVIVILMLYPHINEPKKVPKTMIWALVLGGAFTLLMFMMAVTVFGVYETGRMAWPVLELAKMVKIGNFIERIEALFLALWVSSAFINSSILCYCSITGFAQLIGRKSYKKLIIPFMVFYLLVSLFPKGLLQIIEIYYWFQWLGLFITFVLPLVLLVKGRKGGKTIESK